MGNYNTFHFRRIESLDEYGLPRELTIAYCVVVVGWPAGVDFVTAGKQTALQKCQMRIELDQNDMPTHPHENRHSSPHFYYQILL